MKGKQLRSMSLVPQMLAGNKGGSTLSKKHHSRKAISLTLTQVPSLNSRVGRRQSKKPRMEKCYETLKITMIFTIPKEQPTHNGADHKCWPYIYHKKCSDRLPVPSFFRASPVHQKPTKVTFFFRWGLGFSPRFSAEHHSGVTIFTTRPLELVTGRWQLKHFVFSPLVGEMIQFDEYFSNGLVQPPTRLTVKI